MWKSKLSICNSQTVTDPIVQEHLHSLRHVERVFEVGKLKVCTITIVIISNLSFFNTIVLVH